MNTPQNTKPPPVAAAAAAPAVASATVASPVRRSKRSRKSSTEKSTTTTTAKKAKLASPANAKDEGCSCVICQDEMIKNEISKVDGCLHLFCFKCIETWSERQNTCPLCQSRFTVIHKVHPKKRPTKNDTPNSKKVKERDQRADYTNPHIESLLQQLYASSHGSAFQRFIFSQSFGIEDSDTEDEGMPVPISFLSELMTRSVGRTTSRGVAVTVSRGSSAPSSSTVAFRFSRVTRGSTAETAIDLCDSDDE